MFYGHFIPIAGVLPWPSARIHLRNLLQRSSFHVRVRVHIHAVYVCGYVCGYVYGRRAKETSFGERVRVRASERARVCVSVGGCNVCVHVCACVSAHAAARFAGEEPFLSA